MFDMQGQDVAHLFEMNTSFGTRALLRRCLKGHDRSFKAQASRFASTRTSTTTTGPHTSAVSWLETDKAILGSVQSLLLLL